MVEITWPIPLTERQVVQLEQFRVQLVDWNERMNLTGITAEAEVYVKHFYDSLAVAQMPEWLSVCKPSIRLIDVGTGAGFPGIPLAIAYPDVDVVLCDSLQKRVQFLQAVTDELGLANVTCVHARSEDLGQAEAFRGTFDVAVSRAVARLNVLMELMCPLLKRDGLGLCYKGPNLEEEMQDGQRAAKKLGCFVGPVFSYMLPLDMGSRRILPFHQESLVKRMYPRKAGLPQRDPL